MTIQPPLLASISWRVSRIPSGCWAQRIWRAATDSTFNGAGESAHAMHGHSLDMAFVRSGALVKEGSDGIPAPQA